MEEFYTDSLLLFILGKRGTKCFIGLIVCVGSIYVTFKVELRILRLKMF